MHFHFDYETSSEADLKEVGLYNYVHHSSTKILMMAYAFGNEDVKIWFPHEGAMPSEVAEAFRNPDVELAAYHSAFERYFTEVILDIKIPAERFQDPQPSARYLSLPSSLKDVGSILGLPYELRKDDRGEELMALFSFPQTRKKKEGGGTYFNDCVSHPAEWLQYAEYCMQDVRAEREVARRLALLKVYPLPERERKIWVFDQMVNDRGMPTDRDFVEKALRLAERAKKEKLEEQNAATGLDNANSTAQLLPWVQERGYPLSNLRKQNIEIVLKDKEAQLTRECRDVLTARMEAGSTSYKKLEAILRNISSDGQLRNQFIYMGSPRCGRWSGSAVQLHNLARPGMLNNQNFEEVSVLNEAREMVYREDYEGLKAKYGSVLLAIKFLIRTVFVA